MQESPLHLWPARREELLDYGAHGGVTEIHAEETSCPESRRQSRRSDPGSFKQGLQISRGLNQLCLQVALGGMTDHRRRAGDQKHRRPVVAKQGRARETR